MPVRLTLDRKPIADPDVWDFLNDCYPSNLDPYSFEVFSLLGDSMKLESIWREYQSEILENYISQYPGKRVSHWWTFSGPQIEVKWPGISRITEPRKMISGYCYLPWRNEKNLKPSYYKGIANASGLFTIYDDADQAYFESQASYLKRYGLLSKSEEEKLTEKDFKPECYINILLERRKLRPY